jgi:flagellar biosynthetic protein FlhB
MDRELLLVWNQPGWKKRAGLEEFRFDLQLFAAEDEGRTEEPTEYKKRKAREEGNLPRSTELTGIIVFLAGFWTISILGEFLFGQFLRIMRYYLDNLLTITVSPSSVVPFFLDMMVLSATILLPMMAVGIVFSVLGNVIQGGFVFTTKKISFNFGKIISNIPQNLKKMFMSKETAFNLMKTIAKVVGVFFIAWLVLNDKLTAILNTSRMDMVKGFGLLWSVIFQFVSFAGVLLLVFAAVDYAWQRYIFNESLKMTKQEIKQEFKEQEGDPEIKAKIREMEHRILSRKMAQEVPKADVIITNPTHIAVALKYDASYMNAPVLVAKGEGTMAQKIKEIARESNVTIIENKPLAREIYKRVDLGGEIPADLFMAVARILSLVYQTKGGAAA